jgi:hypothetical protein
MQLFALDARYIFDLAREKRDGKKRDKKEHAREKREGKKPVQEAPDRESIERKEPARETSSSDQLKGILKYPAGTSLKKNKKYVRFSKRNTTHPIEKTGNSYSVKRDEKIPEILMSNCDESDLLNIRDTIERIKIEKAQIAKRLESRPEKKTQTYLESLLSRLSVSEAAFIQLRNSRISRSAEEREAFIKLGDSKASLSDEEKKALHKEVLREQALYKEANILLRERYNAILEEGYREVEAAEKREEQEKGNIIISRGNEIIENGSFIIEKPAGNISREDIPVAAAFADILRKNSFLISHANEEIPLRSQQIIKDITLTSMFSEQDIIIPGKIALYLKDNDPDKILYARVSNTFLKYMLEYSLHLTTHPYDLEIIDEDGLLLPGDLLWACIHAKKEEKALYKETANISSSSSSNFSSGSSSPESDEEFNQEEGSSLSFGWKRNEEGASSSSSAWQGTSSASFHRQADNRLPKGEQSQARKEF